MTESIIVALISGVFCDRGFYHTGSIREGAPFIQTN